MQCAACIPSERARSTLPACAPLTASLYIDLHDNTASIDRSQRRLQEAEELDMTIMDIIKTLRGDAEARVSNGNPSSRRPKY